jgi:hypothetical protein
MSEKEVSMGMLRKVGVGGVRMGWVRKRVKKEREIKQSASHLNPTHDCVSLL